MFSCTNCKRDLLSWRLKIRNFDDRARRNYLVRKEGRTSSDEKSRNFSSTRSAISYSTSLLFYFLGRRKNFVWSLFYRPWKISCVSFDFVDIIFFFFTKHKKMRYLPGDVVQAPMQFQSFIVRSLIYLEYSLKLNQRLKNRGKLMEKMK